MTRYDCKTADGVDDCLRQTAAARAAAEATADAAAARPWKRTTWPEDSDEALVAATEAAEQVVRAQQARRRPMRVSRLAQVAKILVPELDIIALDKFLRLSRDARDCATEEHERRNQRRRWVALPLVGGEYMYGGVEPLSDSETEGYGSYEDEKIKFEPCPDVVLHYDDGRGEFVPAAGDPAAEFRWDESYDKKEVGDRYEEGEDDWDILYNDDRDEFKYRGERIRVFWLPAPEDGVGLPPRWNLQRRRLRSRGVRDPEIDIYPVGDGAQSEAGLRYDVLARSDVETHTRERYDGLYVGTRRVSGRIRIEGFRAPTREQLVWLVGHAQTKTRLKIIEILSEFQVRAMLRKLGRPVRLFGDCDCEGDCDVYCHVRSNGRLRLRAIANAEADTSREERELVAALLAQALAEEVP